MKFLRILTILWLSIITVSAQRTIYYEELNLTNQADGSISTLISTNTKLYVKNGTNNFKEVIIRDTEYSSTITNLTAGTGITITGTGREREISSSNTGSGETSVLTTNNISVINTNLTYAISALPSAKGRTARILNLTTNTSSITATVSFYDSTSNSIDKLFDLPEANLSTAVSVSNAVAGATNLYVNGLNAMNGSILEIKDSNNPPQYVNLVSLSSFVSSAWTLSYNGAQEVIYSLCIYNGKLYAGQGNGTGDGDVLVFDGSTWTISYNGAQETIQSLCVYNGKLYAGQGNGTGDGDVLVFDGTTWSISYDGAQEAIYSLCVYNGKLYAGQGTGAGDGDVLVFDGSTWNISYDGPEEYIFALSVYNNKLYAGKGGPTAGDGDVLVFDGSTWNFSYAGAREYIIGLGAYNGYLYAAQGSVTAGLGDVYVFNGSTWSLSYDSAFNQSRCTKVYNGKIYAGFGPSTGNGDVYVLQTTQLATISPPLTHGRTNFTVSVVNQYPITTIATNSIIKFYSDNVGQVQTQTVQIVTEVME